MNNRYISCAQYHSFFFESEQSIIKWEQLTVWHTWYLKSEERTIGKIPNLIMNKLFMNKKKSTSEKSYLLNTKDIINVKEKDWTQEKNQKKMLNYY